MPDNQTPLHVFLQTVYAYLPLFWGLVFVVLSILSFARFRTTISGLILGTVFGLHTLLTVANYVIDRWALKGVDYNQTSRVIFNLVSNFGLPTLLQIAMIVGIALIPRSMRQLDLPRASD